MAKPRRGELYWADLNPVRGREQGGRRPVLVVQNDRGNENSDYTVVVALSSAPLSRRYPFTVPLAAGEGGLPRSSYVNCAQIRTVDDARLEGLIGRLDEARMREVDEALRYELALE
jgi:mRNA interferase MazF